MKAIDFFCGAGGLTRGLLDIGIDVIAGIDLDESACKTYEENNKPSKFIHADIRKLETTFLRKLIGKTARRDLLLVGCAPCQSFSTQRKGNSKRPDSTLLSAFGKIVESLQPGQILIENVPGMKRVKGYSTYRRFIKMLESNGYMLSENILDAKYYGVPQSRRRLILIAMKGVQPELPAKIFGVDMQPFQTVRQAISHYPPVLAGEEHARIPNHIASPLSKLNLTRIKSTPLDGGDRRSWPRRLVLNCHKGSYSGHTDVYGRMYWDEPAPTLTGKCTSISNGRYGHPEQHRAITLREAASLQTFNDDYVFYADKTRNSRHIGNAVPVIFAQHLGEKILELRYK